jgi:DNA-binding beta-propeller fold protein YncE
MGRNKVITFGAVAFAAILGIGVSIDSALARRQGGTKQEFASTGKPIEPLTNIPGMSPVSVGSFPVNAISTPDGKFVISTNAGYRQQLTVFRASDGRVASKLDFGGRGKIGLYYGLAVSTDADGSTRLFASRGSEEKVSEYRVSAVGELTFVRDFSCPGKPSPNPVAGVAVDADSVWAVINTATTDTKLKGAVAQFDRKTGELKQAIELPGFPFGAALAGGSLFITCERDGVVVQLDPKTGAQKTIRTGENPSYITASKDGKHVLVSNSNSDTLSWINTGSGKVEKTTLIRPAALRGLGGFTPLGSSFITDKLAFVAVADMNAVAVIDPSAGELKGYLPAGWYPTSTALTQNGKRLFVLNGKGVKAKNPNGKDVGALGQYVLNIIEGAVTVVDVDTALTGLEDHTEQVLRMNRATKPILNAVQKRFVKPPIEHVIYVIKENRTYDQVLGALPKGNGEPSLVLFGREVTPNQHALAERFVQLDNFHVCAEVSADGWNWSTSGAANEYTSRNSIYNYAGRGRQYDFEGTNNGVAVDMQGVRDVATASGGYIWDAMAKAGLSYRNYGSFLSFQGGEADKRDTRFEPDNVPTKKALVDHTEPTFRRYDMNYADSEAWVKYGLEPAPRQLATFGKEKDPARMTSFLRDYKRLLGTGKVPKFMIMRLGRDHTSGTAAGTYSPRAMVADNDYAVGQLVEAVSNGPLWKKTAIFILEDDAQAGFDHVDAHRSIAFVVSAYNKRSFLDSRFYNTDSMLLTMSRLLGAKPWNQYIATAFPMDVFDKKPVNAEPYKAILPAREIVAEVNTPRSFRSADSARLVKRFEEETHADEALNDILWGSIKGAKVPRPATPGARWRTEDMD